MDYRNWRLNQKIAYLNKKGPYYIHYHGFYLRDDNVKYDLELDAFVDKKLNYTEVRFKYRDIKREDD